VSLWLLWLVAVCSVSTVMPPAASLPPDDQCLIDRTTTAHCRRRRRRLVAAVSGQRLSSRDVRRPVLDHTTSTTHSEHRLLSI